MHYVEESKKSVQEVVETMQRILPNFSFGVLHVHNVKDTLSSKGVDFDDECQILDICNPKIAKEFLSCDMSLSVVMPCKITVYTEDGITKIAMNSLTQLVDDINPDLTQEAQKIQNTLLQVISEVK